MNWLIHVDLCYPHEVNISPTFSGPHTYFIRITYYIFVEEMVLVRGWHVFHYASDPEYISEHQFKDHCYLCVIMPFVFVFGGL